MTEQLELRTDRAFARATDPQTSHDAARSVDHIRESQSAILTLLKHFGPMTHEQMIACYCVMPQQSESGIRTRCRELVRLGHVVDSGQRCVLASGRKAIVWEAV